MSTFLTVKEAAQRTGKSPSSIRRLIYPIIKDDKHPDRASIEPNPENAAALRLKGESFPWRVSEELLHRIVPAEAQREKGSHSTTERAINPLEAELIAMLRRELETKNEQILQLNERLREGNILMGNLQQRLALTEGRDTTTTEPASKPKRSPSASTEKGSSIVSKPAKPKKGLFSRWFR